MPPGSKELRSRLVGKGETGAEKTRPRGPVPYKEGVGRLNPLKTDHQNNTNGKRKYKILGSSMEVKDHKQAPRRRGARAQRALAGPSNPIDPEKKGGGEVAKARGICVQPFSNLHVEALNWKASGTMEREKRERNWWHRRLSIFRKEKKEGEHPQRVGGF